VENDCCCIGELLNKIGLVFLVFECCSLVDVFGRLLIENIGMVGDGILDKTLRLSTIWAVMVIKKMSINIMQSWNVEHGFLLLIEETTGVVIVWAVTIELI